MGTKAIAAVNMDVATVIHMLNKAYADEWLAFMQYWTAAKVVKGILRKEIEKELKEHAFEELEHAEKLAERIIQLGGKLLTTPQEIIKESTCNYVEPAPTGCCCEIVAQTLASERCAIMVYKKLMEETHGKDQMTYHLAMSIQKDELDHEEDFQNFQDDFEMFQSKLKTMQK